MSDRIAKGLQFRIGSGQILSASVDLLLKFIGKSRSLIFVLPAIRNILEGEKNHFCLLTAHGNPAAVYQHFSVPEIGNLACDLIITKFLILRKYAFQKTAQIGMIPEAVPYF